MRVATVADMVDLWMFLDTCAPEILGRGWEKWFPALVVFSHHRTSYVLLFAAVPLLRIRFSPLVVFCWFQVDHVHPSACAADHSV